QSPTADAPPRLRPGRRHRRSTLHNQVSSRQATWEIGRQTQPLAALERCSRADKNMTDSVVRRQLIRLSWRRRVHSWHPRQEPDVVRAVPWLIQLEFLVQLFFFNPRKEQHAPTQQRSIILAVHDGRRQAATSLVEIAHGEYQ